MINLYCGAISTPEKVVACSVVGDSDEQALSRLEELARIISPSSYRISMTQPHPMHLNAAYDLDWLIYFEEFADFGPSDDDIRKNMRKAFSLGALEE